ncbi:MAG: pentapeptide repeat-containing protein [Planctomycetota bacterium]
MANRDHLRVVESGPKALANWRAAHPGERLDLSNCPLLEARWREADLRNADLSDSDLSCSMLVEADLRGALLRRTELTEANLDWAKLDGADLAGADLQGASLDGVDLTAADLCDVNLSEVDLRGATGFELDGNDITGTRFPAGVFKYRDPWTRLKTAYTGVMAASHLTFLLIFLAPYSLRAVRWTLLGDGEGEAYWRLTLLLGWDRGAWVIISSTTLLAYNALRLALTWRLSIQREEERRSCYAPRRVDYWWCWIVHKYFMQWVVWFAIASGLWHITRWLFETVYVGP